MPSASTRVLHMSNSTLTRQSFTQVPSSTATPGHDSVPNRCTVQVQPTLPRVRTPRSDQIRAARYRAAPENRSGCALPTQRSLFLTAARPRPKTATASTPLPARVRRRTNCPPTLTRGRRSDRGPDEGLWRTPTRRSQNVITNKFAEATRSTTNLAPLRCAGTAPGRSGRYKCLLDPSGADKCTQRP
jgi:hypothetical protein